jgi:hypothetical protein
VAIIDAGVLVLLLLSFEETLFPRFLFTNTLPISTIPSDNKDIKAGQGTQMTTSSSGSSLDEFPKRTLLQRLKPWVYYRQDHTTYWNYFRRPFFLLTFPNVIIVSAKCRNPCYYSRVEKKLIISRRRASSSPLAAPLA